MDHGVRTDIARGARHLHEVHHPIFQVHQGPDQLPAHRIVWTRDLPVEERPTTDPSEDPGADIITWTKDFRSHTVHDVSVRITQQMHVRMNLHPNVKYVSLIIPWCYTTSPISVHKFKLASNTN